MVDEALGEVIVIPGDEEEEEEEEPEPGKKNNSIPTVLICFSLALSSEPVKKQVTVLVIKPDAVRAGQTENIIEKVVYMYS